MHNFSANYPKQIRNPKQMPAFVKSGNNYFELISIGTHLDKGYTNSEDFDAAHWVSYVKDTTKNEWHFCDDKHVDGSGNYENWANKHQECITNDINKILQKTSKYGCNYIYKKCDKSKYDANKYITEDISNIAFDKNGKGITKSPLYLISAKEKNYALQKDKPSNEDFKSAVESLKNHLQDPNVGILDQNGQIKKELISGQNYNDIDDNVIDDDFTEDNMKHNYDGNTTSFAKYTTGRKAVFIFSGIFAIAAIILAIKALTIACIIVAAFTIVLFIVGCFYNQLKKAVKSCLPGGIIFDNNKEYQVKQKLMLKDKRYPNDDPYGNPEIDNGNPLYEQK